MKVRTRRLLMLLILVLMLPGLAAVQAQAPDPALRVRPGRVWVRLRDGKPAELGRKAAALAEGELDALIPQLDGAILRVPVGQEVAVARRLSARADVVYAVPICRVQALWDPDDTYYPLYQWPLAKIGAPRAWDVVRNAQAVVIAVLDTGIDPGHPDLAGAIWINEGEIAGNGIDDDGNGKVDDRQGWNLVSGTNDATDDHGHGTHVAGIAAAMTNNGIGIAGLGAGARIMPVKVLDAGGSGWDSDIALGVVYAADNGARVINLSLGVPPKDDWDPSLSPMSDAVAYAREHGALVVAAAGNSRGAVNYPAAYPEAMAVAATDSNDQQAEISCYGPEISVAAPGVSVFSTWAWVSSVDGQKVKYTWMSGTSMAAPHVAGLAALVWARHPGYTPAQVQQAIERSADDVNAATYPGKDVYLGYGRINAAKALGDLPELSHRLYLPYVRVGY